MEEKEIINNDQENLESEEENNESVEKVSSSEEKQPDELDQSIEIKKPNPDDKPYDQKVEDERGIIIAQSKKGNLLSTISIVVVIALSITGLVLVFNNMSIPAYILLGCALVALIVFSIIIHRVGKPDVKNYIVKASTAVNEYVFADNRFTEVRYDPSNKIQLEDIANDGVYKDLRRVASRNVCEGLFNGRSFKVCEAAFFKPIVNRREQPAFIGKYLVLPNDLHFEGRIVLIKKGETDADIPDALDDLTQLENEGKFFIYAPNENALKEVDKKFIKGIKEFDVSKHLMNLTIILWAGRTIVYASYDDPTITLPFNEPYQADTASDYRKDLIELLELSQLLLKE